MTVNTWEGKITAKKDTLNAIVIAFARASEKYKDEGSDVLASAFDRTSEEIYTALKEAGYYD